MESKDELKEIDIKNRTCYYSDDIIADRDMYSVDILLDKNSYETYENIPLRIRVDKIDGFIRVRGGENRHLVLFDFGLFDKICDWIKYVALFCA